MKLSEIIKSLVSGGVTAALVFCLQRSRGYEVFHSLSDAFFCAGVLHAGVGGLLFVASKGVFDPALYSIHSLFTVTFKRESSESLTDYMERKNKIRRPFASLLAVGGAFIVLSVAALFLH